MCKSLHLKTPASGCCLETGGFSKIISEKETDCGGDRNRSRTFPPKILTISINACRGLNNKSCLHREVHYCVRSAHGGSRDALP